MEIKLSKDYEKLSSLVAIIVAAQILENPQSKLVLPTGSTPLGMYEELVRRKLDWSLVETFNLDEYIMNPDHPYSYHSYRPTLSFEDKMNVNKGIDLCILGIGSNGHIAFNEPGSSFKSRTRVVDLSEQTIQDNSRFFDSIDDVPKQAITMGLGTIMESKRIILMANGKHKLNILKVAMNGEVTEDVPASILQKHNDAEVFYCD